MADVRPIPEHPTNADLALAIGDLHYCLEEHRKLTTDTNVVLSAQVKGIITKIEPIEHIQKRNGAEILKLRKTSLATAKNLNEAKDKLDKVCVTVSNIDTGIKEFNKSAWKFVAAIVLAIITGAVGVAYNSIKLHQDTAYKVETTASSLSQSTKDSKAEMNKKLDAIQKATDK
jgi:hypothetical protein